MLQRNANPIKGDLALDVVGLILLSPQVSLSKKYKNRMRSEHAAIIALSKSHSQYLDADAVIVLDQRTAL